MKEKMACLLQDVDVQKLALSEARTGRAGMTIRGLADGAIVARVSEAIDCEVLYEPSTFQGTGQETRLNIVIRAPEKSLDALRAMQAALLPDGYASSVREGCIRAKIDVTKVQFYAPDGVEAQAPASYRPRCHAALEIKGTYQSRQGAGLLLEVTALQLGGTAPAPNPFI